MDTIQTALDSGDENVFYSPKKRFETPGSLDFSPRKLSMKSPTTHDTDKGSSSIMLSKDLNRPPSSARSGAFRSAPSLAPPEPKKQSPNSHRYGRQTIVTSLEDDEIDPRTYVERWDTVENKGEFTFSRSVKPLQGHIRYVNVDYTPMGMPLSNSTSPINLSFYPMPPTNSGMPFYDAIEYNPEGPTDEAVLLSVLGDEFEEDQKDKQKVGFLSSLWTLLLAVIFGLSDESYFEHYRWFRFTSTYGRELDAARTLETRIFREINLDILPDYVELEKAMDIAQKYHRGKSGYPFVNSMRSVDLEEGIELQTYKRHSYNPY